MSNQLTLPIMSHDCNLTVSPFRGSEEAVPGPSVFPSGEPGVSGDFWGGRRKAVRDRLALQGGTGDFP